jgi:cytidylate kinase
MKIVVINGPPASGKTSLIERLNHADDYTVISKDSIKEDLFNSATSRVHWYNFWKYEHRAWDIFEARIADGLRQQTPMIIEANITAPLRERLHRQLGATSAREIFCYASPSVAVRRFVQRMHDEKRHPAHFDILSLGAVAAESLLAAVHLHRYAPLFDDTHVLRVDTTHPEHIDYASIVDFIERID